MQKSKNQAVQNFIENLKNSDFEKFEILQKLRKIVFEISSKVQERMMYGGIMFSVSDKDFGGIFVYKNHISFEFTQGFAMKDPEKILEGKGQFRRHLKLKSLKDIKNKNVKFFIEQA